MQQKSLKTFIIGWSFLLLALLCGWLLTTYWSLKNPNQKIDLYHFFWKDIQALALLFSFFILLTAILIQPRFIFPSRASLFFPILIMLICFFGAGEESNWGQNWIHFKTPSWIDRMNQDHRFNLHDLVIDHVDVNYWTKKALKAFILIYAILIPLLNTGIWKKKKTTEITENTEKKKREKENIASQIFEKWRMPTPPVAFVPFMIVALTISILGKNFFVAASQWIDFEEINETLVAAIILGSVIVNLIKWNQRVHQ